MKIILGSKSPRRKEILKNSQFDIEVHALNIPEDITDYNSPQEYVLKTSFKKGLATQKEFHNNIVLCADTVVSIDNKILEKPVDKDDARKMIKTISGRKHIVYTAVYIGYQDKYDNFVCETKVEVGPMTEEEIEEYINTTEPYDKAGGYAVQGIFSKYVKGIEGDFYNVMGLPIYEVNQVLKKYKKICDHQ